ncbi:MAG: CopG family transcriptional regulator [Thermoprotei archaeon]|nr:MAG: CopG family transcriptional regulator [Thermoprotei archaeon]
MTRQGDTRKFKLEENPRTYIVSFHIPRALLDALDRLVEIGVFNNRSEAIRTALYKLLTEYSDFHERRRFMMGYR